MYRDALASVTLAGLALATVGCSLAKSHHGPATSTSRFAYSATASVGDFVSIVVDDVARTIAYDNLSTGQHGTASYTVASDGTYDIVPGSDTGGLDPVKAYEVPGYAFLMSANHTGVGLHPSILTAVHSEPITLLSMTGDYNYMQFRTNSGGIEIGSVAIGSGTVDPNSYWPYGGINNSPPENGLDSGFHGGGPGMAMSGVQEHGSYLKAPDDPDAFGNPQYSYIFKTTGGFFAVDTPNGGLVCLHKASGPAFQAANAGTYHAMIFRKSNVTQVPPPGPGPGATVESPAAGVVATWSMTLDATGNITVLDQGGAPVVTTRRLVAFADAVQDDGTGTMVPAFCSPTKVADPCWGTFNVRIPAAAGSTDTPTDVFVMFLTDAMLISSFTGHQDGSYDYWYGTALRDPTTGG